MRKRNFCVTHPKLALSHFIHFEMSYLKLGSAGNGNMSRIQLTLSHSPVFFFNFSALWELLQVLLLLTVKWIDFWHSSDLLLP